MASGTEPARITKGSRKLLNWGRQHQEYQDDYQSKGRKELVALSTQLTRFSGIVKDITRWKDFACLCS